MCFFIIDAIFALAESIGVYILCTNILHASDSIKNPAFWITFLVGMVLNPLLLILLLDLENIGKRKRRKESEKRARERAETDKRIHNDINTLVTYFRGKMYEVGNPGLTNPAGAPRSHDSVFKDNYGILPSVEVWCSSDTGLTFTYILPTGYNGTRTWCYQAPVFDNRTNKISYFWTLSSDHDNSDPTHIINEHYDEEPYEATHSAAYGCIKGIVEDVLNRHNPSALKNLPN